ncbi:hypothetical protein [Desulfolutivibrio sp.]|uniref:ApeA N-terminal domain 1-containing protein n=1 Tax=Desulfolutivibrio sp. TaxID=2773296 RepID=UPI002F96338D
MWIFFPDQNSKVGSDASSQNAETPILNTSWTGSITPPSASGETWNFEVIRHTDARNIYNEQPFRDHKTVVGLLDYQTPCTLIYPTALNTHPGSFGINYIYPRVILKGTFQALLTNIPVDNFEEDQFISLEMNSLSFLSWYGAPAILPEYDYETQAACIKSTESTEYKFDIQHIGKATCSAGNSLSTAHISGTIKSSARLLLAFPNPVNLKTIIKYCIGLDSLFCVLIGHQTKRSTFNVCINKTYTMDNHEYEFCGELNIGGGHWKSEEYQHFAMCLHHNGFGGGTIDVILNKYFSDQENISQRISTIGYCKFVSKNLVDKFKVLLPVLEQCLEKKYTSMDELSFINTKNEFFEWIDSARSASIQEFAKKHVTIKEKKSPSLKILLQRAITDINCYGFSIDIKMADKISKRRNLLFHSAIKFREEDVMNFHSEYRIAIAILTLITFTDLGINISCLKKKCTC